MYAAAELPSRVSNSDAHRVHPTSNLVRTETFVDTLTFNTKTIHWTRASLAHLLKTRLIVLRFILMLSSHNATIGIMKQLAF
jgi:hypothetical protein